MLYLVAVLVGLVAAGVALILPVWLRDGRSGVVRQSGRIMPMLGIILAVLLAIAWVTSSGRNGLANVALAAASTAVAAWLIVQDRPPSGERPWMRPLLLFVLIVSILVLALGVFQLIRGT
jgi:hypothetical protein